MAPKDAPSSYEDLLNPKWKGWVGLETEEYQWFYHWMQILGRDTRTRLYEKICRQNPQMRAGHTLLAQLVAAGEIALATVVYSIASSVWKASGAPVDWVRFKGPTITRSTPSPFQKKRRIPTQPSCCGRFRAVERRAKLLRSLRRIPARPDVAPDPPSLTQGLQLYPARPEGMIENYNDTVARFNEIFNRAR